MQTKLLNLLIKKKRILIKAEGTSMLPVIHPGDVLNLLKTNFFSLKEGEIILVKKKRIFFIHRIIYKGSKFLITKGDAAPLSDGKIYPHQISAKLINLTRRGKLISPDDYNLIQSTYYFKELIKVIESFNRHKLEHVFLKGLPLYLHLQQKIPSRLYADCDILIHKRNFRQAAFLLKKSGFRFSDRSYSFLHKRLKKKQTELMFVKKNGFISVVLDVHLEPVFLMNQISPLEALYPHNFLIKISEYFLEKRKPVNLNNKHFYLLSDDHQVIYLALHFFHHNFSGFYRLHLLRDAIKKYSGSWAELIRTIKLYKLENFVYPSFYFCEKYFPGLVPEKIMATLSVPDKILRRTKEMVKEMEKSSDDNYLAAGWKRFRNIIFFSPQSNMKKISVFFYPPVLYSIGFFLVRKIIAFNPFKKSRLKLSNNY